MNALPTERGALYLAVETAWTPPANTGVTTANKV